MTIVELDQPPVAPLIVLSGPSGVGKQTVLRHLRYNCPEIWVSVSATTRLPRPGETDGVSYHFVSVEEFRDRVARDDFLEWAEFTGNLYGTPRQPVEQHRADGVPVLLEIELHGARQIRRTIPDALLVFLAPPSWDELVRRLTGRATETPTEIEGRLRVAKQELAAESEFDVTLINTTVEDVAEQLLELVRTAEAAAEEAEERSVGGQLLPGRTRYSGCD